MRVTRSQWCVVLQSTKSCHYHLGGGVLAASQVAPHCSTSGGLTRIAAQKGERGLHSRNSPSTSLPRVDNVPPQ